jgi:hypothetical protein
MFLKVKIEFDPAEHHDLLVNPLSFCRIGQPVFVAARSRVIFLFRKRNASEFVPKHF